MTNPQLRSESIRITRRLEAQRHSPGRRHGSCSGNYHNATTRNVDVRNLLNRRANVDAVKVLQALIVQSSTKPRTKSPPTRRINFGAYNKLDGIIWKRIRRMAAHILRRTKLTDTLEPTVDREINSDAGDNFIRPIQE